MKSRYWFLLSLLLFVAAALCWRLGEQRQRLREQPAAGATNAPAKLTVWERFIRLPSVLIGKTPSRDPKEASPKPPELLSLSNDPRFPFRLRNSQKKEAELFRSETAVLLRNALVETLEPVNLNMPAHLRAQGDPGSYLVQARGAIDQRFRDVLRGAGAEVVSYVPNNTYLVRGSAALAQQLRVSPRVQSVLPFEPYYKLDMQLLPLAVRREAMPAGRWLNLVLFSGTQEKAKAELRALGAEVKGEQPFPFGHVVTIAPRADSLVALAQMPAVQNIEAYHSPILMNDLSRVRLDVSTNTTDLSPAGNWLGLTGNGVFVGHIDSGTDLAHPQLAGRTFANSVSATTDADGHGTAVAGVIVGMDSTTPSPTNGSIAGATYRGIAPLAQLFPLSLFATDYTNYGNVWLITNAALATNIFIVNNSWGYPVATYDINSALFDDSVRDALPFRPNAQPVTHVFPSGNTGGANSGGLGGAGDTVVSPGNGKNVITVGASELLRLVPNSLIATNTGTNDPIAVAHSDSDNQVADFSGRGNVGVGVEGPAGRFKPDFVAPGAYIATLRASTFTNIQETDAQNMLGSSQWRYESGTSLAAGKVSGLLALMQEFFAVNYGLTNGLKPSLNKALLVNRAETLSPSYDFAVNSPVTHQGWGIPSLSNTLPSATAFSFLTNSTAVSNRVVIVDESGYFNTNQLASGQFHAYDITLPTSTNVFSLTNTLKITLAWTDPAGNPISSTKLVNDLDLYVTNNASTNGMQWEGNNFASGTIYTQPTTSGGQTQRDSVNNVENVFITGLAGNDLTNTYRVYVIGRRVNVNAVSGDPTNGVVTNVVQDYTLVISSDTGVGITVRPASPFLTTTNRPVNIVTNAIPYLNERVGANPQLVVTNTNGVAAQWNFYVFTNQNLPPVITNIVTNIVSGTTNVVTNLVRAPITNGGPFVVLATFLPPNLARARNAEADVDLFVARDQTALAVPNAFNLTNLDPAVLSHPSLLRSTNRGGSELISLTNSSLGEVFYVGIKSEDKQAASYGFFAAASQFPFATSNSNGTYTINLFPVPMDIPDGTPEGPAGVTLYGIFPTNVVMQGITMTNTFVHENIGDLVGTLSHNGTFITMNSHYSTNSGIFGGLQTNELHYDDFYYPPDGPGDVTDLVGQDAVGLWVFEVYDNAPFHTGRVDYASIYVIPYTNQYSTNNPNVSYRTVTLQAGQSFVDFLDVPAYATNLDVDIVGGLAGVPGPAAAGTGVDLLAGVPGVIPTSFSATNNPNLIISTLDLDNTDAAISPHLRISSSTQPALSAGRWNFRVINNSPGTLTLTLRYTLGLDLTTVSTEVVSISPRTVILDASTTNLFNNVPSDRVISGVDVGLAIQHPRVSDLVIHLFSPSGKRVLLFEDRGGTNGATTADLRANFTENTNYSTHIDTNGLAPLGFTNLGYLLPIKFVPAPYSAVVSPPLLYTNATNLVFGHSNSLGLVKESPGGLAHHGQALFMAGAANRNSTNDAFMVSYLTPIVTNRYYTNFVTNFIGGVAVSTQFVSFSVTNWHSTNFWAGSLSGYRGPNQITTTPDRTFFSGVAANADGVFAVGQTHNYFPPATLVWSGDSNRHVYDVDLGCTAGSVTLTHLTTNSPRANLRVEYEGRRLMDFTPAAGVGATNYLTNLLFHGASRFLRVTVNFTNLATQCQWTNFLAIYRSNGITHAAATFIPNDFVKLLPAMPPAYTAPTPTTFSTPVAVALDSSNNVYVVDEGSNDRILKFMQAVTIPNFGVVPPVVTGTNGTYVPLTLASGGFGVAAYNTLNNPRGLVVHTNGDIYVADTGNNLIKRYLGDGTLTNTWGDAASAAGANAGSSDLGSGSFNTPEGISIGSNGEIYIADTGNNLIRIIGTNGAVRTIILPPAFVTTFGDLSGPRGIVSHVTTSNVLSVALAAAGNMSQSNRFGTRFVSGTNLYVADTVNNRIVWLQWSNTAWTAQHLAGDVFPTFAAARVDSTNTLARFSAPSGITRDGAGNLYVSDAGSHLLRRVTPLGDVQTVAGDRTTGASGNVDSSLGASARFDTPLGLAADHFGTLFVADSVNAKVRVVTPYQSNMPTNAFIALFPFNGPTNSPVMGVPPVYFSRGITNSVFGLEHGGADSRDYFSGVATATEFGTNGTATNFLFGVGSSQFSTNSGAGLTAFDRMFLTKFATNGRPIWTRGHMPAAVIHPVLDVNSNITSLVLDSGGSNYSAVPVVTILDPLNPVLASRAIGVTVTVTGGVVDPPPATSLAGPFIAPRVYVEAPVSAHMPANGLAVAHGTNVIAAGYTNISTVLAFTNNLPFLMCLETTNGTLRWATNSTNSGHYNSVAVAGDKLIAVGAAYPGGNTLNSSNLLEMWSLGGTQLLSLTTNFGAGRTSWLSQVIAIDTLDRAYAVGSVLNSDKTVDAVLLEIDLQSLAVISVVTNNITNFNSVPTGQSTNYGKAIATDGVDLYVAVEGPGDINGHHQDRQAAVFRYRAKNFYLPEESLSTFVGERTWATNMFYTNIAGTPTNYVVTNTAWRLQIADTRAGGNTLTNNSLVLAWNLNFSYTGIGTNALATVAGVSNPIVLLSTTPQYFRVRVPSAAGSATNLITATAPVRVSFHPASLPLPGDPGTREMFSGAATGSFIVSTNANAIARLRPGSEYYLAVQAVYSGPPVDVTLSVNFDQTELPPPVTTLTSGNPVSSAIPRSSALSHFSFDVSAANSAAMFEITSASGDVNLYLRRSNSPSSLPTGTEFDYRSANPGTGIEQIFLVTNSAAASALTPGTWFASVQNGDNAPVTYTVRATTASATPYNVVTAADGQPQDSVTSPGNAPNTLFKVNVPTAQSALLFEVRNLTGAGDLIVRKDAFPLSTTNNGANFRAETLPEIVTVRTNASMPSLVGDWYFGVLNPGATHIAYTVMARQPTNGVLLSSSPIQIVGPPGGGQFTGGTNFGFDLDVVPGEKYQVQYKTNVTATSWLVLTNIVAPADGVINFTHSGALTNRNLYYRIQVVP